MPTTSPEIKPPEDAAMRVARNWAIFRAGIEAELPVVRTVPTSRVGHEPMVQPVRTNRNRNKTYNSKLIREGKP